MKTYSTNNIIELNMEDRKIFTSLINEVLAVSAEFTGCEPFYFEYKNVMLMFAPDTHFFFEIPDAPLPSLGGLVPSDLILAGQTAANDRLPAAQAEDSLPPS